ncbi:MAG: hypothetical protein COB84_04800 [Rhodobacteraceae bacterium]|nr:MAG: hypothetical protein COB84_04800 [Paracoccaceae bacterium]
MKRLLFILLCLPALAFGQDYPQSVSSYVNDFAGIIDAETKTRLETRLQELRETQGIEMTVVTIERVRDYASTQSVPDFATGLFNAWGVGNAKRNDGVLFLVARGDRAMFIALGSGYSDEYDVRMDRVFTYHVKPYFVKDDYSSGIEVGVEETIKRTVAEWIDDAPKQSPWAAITDFLFFGVFGLIWAFVLWKILHKWITDKTYKLRKCPQCQNRSLHRNRAVEQKATKTAKGKEQVSTRCDQCDYRDVFYVSISRYSSSSSSSGGSFGGGGSSGGGGGGSW